MNMLRERRDNELQQEPFTIENLEEKIELEEKISAIEEDIYYHEDLATHHYSVVTELNNELIDYRNQLAELEGR